MPSKISKAVGTTEYRNRVRGLLSATKQRGFGVDDKARNRRSKLAMRTVILEARHSLSSDQYVDHLHWLYKQVTGSSSNGATIVGQGLLFSNMPTRPANLETEIRWITARLIAAADTINSHLAARQTLTDQVLAGKADEAINTCDQIEVAIGDSHWLVNMRLFILQRFKGIDAQKSYLNRLRSHGGRCISTVYAYLVSIRNEPSVSMQWFKSDIKKRQFSRKHPEHKTYMRFCLIDEIPDSVSGIADLLSIEQAHSDVDLYETLITILQGVHDRTFDYKTKAAIASCVVQFSRNIHDIRISKLGIALGVFGYEEVNALKHSNESALIAICRGDISSANDSLTSFLTTDPASTVWNILASQIRTPCNESIMLVNSPADEIANSISQLCDRSNDFGKAVEDLEKLAKNIRGLPVGPFLSALVKALQEPSAINLAGRLGNCALTTQTWGVLDRIFVQSRNLFTLPDATNEAELLADAALGNYVPNGVDCPVAETISLLISSATKGHPEDAYDLVDKVLNYGVPLSKRWGILTALELYSRNGDYGRSLSLIGNQVVLGQAIGANLPISYALSGLRNSHLKQHGSDITTPIAIDALLRVNNCAETQTLQRISFNQFMRSLGIDYPSTIPTQIINEQLPAYIYFLHEVCVPPVMDMNPAFASSHELLVERRNICALLRTLDTENQQLYDDEIVGITHALSIWEGIKLVDGSRIHVDEDAFSRAVHLELEGSFNRYAFLVESGVGVAEDFDVVLRGIIQQDGYTEGLEIPKNEADELLANMVFRMKEMFLSNAIFGLDGYVSKRIRHGSLIGHLRGPVERHKLITQRIKSGSIYEPNHHWMLHFTETDVESKRRLERALDEFSRSFDRELFVLKDEKLQVKLKHSDGIFDIPITGAALHVIRSSIKATPHLEDLSRIVIASFWSLLTPALKQAQELIRVRFQSRVSELFNRLQAAASPCVRSDSGYGDFINAIRVAQEETQIQIASVSGWFERSESEDHGRQYTLDDAVDIGVESAKSAYSHFKPYVIKRCDPVLMPSPSLQLIADVLLIALGNIYMHSGLGNEPLVNIESVVDNNLQVVSFVIMNQISNKVSLSDIQSTLSSISTRIEVRDFEPYVGSEGKSGLLKLAAMVYQSKHGQLRFGIEDMNFVLRFSMSIFLNTPIKQETAA